MVLILFHDQRSRSTSELWPSEVSTFPTCFLPELFYPEFMICRRVSSCRSTTMNHFGSSGLWSFKLSTFTFSGVLSPEVDDPSTRVSHRSIVVNRFGSSGVLDPMPTVTYFSSRVPSLWTARSVTTWRNTRSRHMAQSGG
jgi:hypothetical protein